MHPRPLDSASRLPWEDSVSVERTPESHPGVSIVIPIFNSGSFLERTLRSLLFNDLEGVEIIVMDGGSTDDTPRILEHYEHLFDVCVSERDEGQSDAINKGFSHAKNPILYWLNGDDLLLPNALTRVRAEFSASPACEVLVGDAYMTDLDLKPVRHVQFSKERLCFDVLIDYAANHLVQPSVFFSRNAWKQCGPLRTDLHYAMDADLFLTMSSAYRLDHLKEDLAYSVYHEQCKTRNKRSESIMELALVQANHGGLSEALKTLKILDSEAGPTAAGEEIADSAHDPESDGCPRCRILEKKLTAIESEVEKNKKLLLEIDPRET